MKIEYWDGDALLLTTKLSAIPQDDWAIVINGNHYCVNTIWYVPASDLVEIHLVPLED